MPSKSPAAAPPAPALHAAARPVAKPEMVRLDVRGMHCASCVSAVERALGAVPGVESAAVDLIGHRADVRVDSARVDAARLVAAIREAGYEAAPRGAAASEDAGERRARRLEERRRTRGLLVKSIVTIAIGCAAMALSMPLHSAETGGGAASGTHPGGASFLHDPGALRWALFALTLPILLFSGSHFFTGAWRAARRGRADMSTLVALGTGTAFVGSALVTIAPEWVRAAGLPADVYYEAIPWVIGLVTLGRYLEERAKHRAGDAVRRLAEETPPTARIVGGDGVERDAPVASVAPGDLLRLRPGERVPVDGVVERGATSVDESLLTGESMPVPKREGDALLGGTTNGAGSIVFRASAVGSESAAARILALLEDAMTAKPRIQRVVDRVAGVFVPAVLAVAALAVVGWLAFGPAPRAAFALHAWVTTLVIACPCAMGLAVPAAIAVATGTAARRGVLVRSAAVLETAHEIDVVVFDKTGTLTEGKPRVVGMEANPREREEGTAADAREALALAASVERGSEHPLAAALLAHAESLEVRLARPAEDLESRAGRGIAGSVEGRRVLVGNARFLDEEDVDAEPLREALAAAERRAETPILVAVDGRAALLLGVRDPVRAGAREAVGALRRGGVRVVLLTGDRRGTAEAVAGEIGIDEVVAEALPWDKVDFVKALRAEGRKVAMVGDGVNDAPALAAADLGIALAGGAGVAAEAADVTLLGRRLDAVPATLRLARAAHRVIRQNLGWAFGYNVLGIPLAAGVFYPWTGWLLSPVVASAAMALSSVSVVTNALRLRNADLD